MKLTNKSLMALGLSTVLVAGLVGAQTSTTPSQTTPGQTTPQTQQNMDKQGDKGGHGHHGGDRGMGGFGFRHVALNTQMSFSFYDADPATGATATETLEFTYGVDSEATFAENFQTARANATFMKVDVSEQTRTIDLSTVDATQPQGLLPRELARPEMLNDASTITATFYDADPASGGTVLKALTFTQGTSSEAGFADEFATAAQSAAFVKVTTSPQTQTVDLSAMPQPGQGFGPGMGQQGFGGQGFGHGHGGHHGGHGQGFDQGQGFGPGQGMNNGNNVPSGPVPPVDPNNSTPANPDDSSSDNS
jgi:hypothetical protein